VLARALARHGEDLAGEQREQQRYGAEQARQHDARVCQLEGDAENAAEEQQRDQVGVEQDVPVGRLRPAIQLEDLVRPIGVPKQPSADAVECVTGLHAIPPLASVAFDALRRFWDPQDPVRLNHSMARKCSSVRLHSPDVCGE
jgi:hypothetical protein